jgi:hypothetical protein
MSKIALRKLFKPAPVLAAALSIVSLSAGAQEREEPDYGIYVGATAGVGVAEWRSGTSTDRANFSGKVFGGYRMTPGLAAEVNYLMFGRLNKANSTSRSAELGYSALSQKETALTLGIDWEVELLHSFTNHLRVGWAIARQSQKVTDVAGATTTKRVAYDTSPYVGAGLSFQFARNMRLITSADWIVNGHNSYYLLGFGASTEF